MLIKSRFHNFIVYRKMLDFKKKLHLKKIQIFFLKFQIVCSIIETSFRQYILEFTNNKWILFLALVVPITFSCQFLESSKYKKVLSLLEQNLPGTLLQSNTISWETFQKTHYLPSSEKSIQFEDHRIAQQFDKTTLYDKEFYRQVLKQIDYWGDFITFEFFKNWISYKKNYLAGFISEKIQKKQPLIFVARDNINSPFYFCYLQDSPKSFSQKIVNIKQYKKNDYQLDEFPQKLANIQYSSQQKTLFKLTDNYELINKVQPKQNEQSLSLLRFELSQFNEASQFIGIKTITKLRENTSENTSLNTQKLQNSELFQAQIQFQTKLAELNQQIQNLFYRKGYILPKNVFLTNSNGLNNVILSDKYIGISAHQILSLIENQINPNTSELNSDKPETQSILINRLMSGFNYPDLQSNDLISFTRQNNYSLYFPFLQFFHDFNVSDKLKIYLGSHFAYPTEYSNFKPDPIRLNLKYYAGKFEGNDSNTQYSGPVIALTEQNKASVFKSTNWFRVRNNLQSILHELDPRQNTQYKFFGNTLSELTDKPSKVKLNNWTFENIQLNKFNKHLLKRHELTAEKELVELSGSYSYEFVVPYFDSQEWHVWLLNQTTNSNQLPYIQSFPIRQLSSLKDFQFNILFDLLDYQNPTKFLNWLNGNDIFNSKLINHEYPLTQAAIPSSIVRQNYTTVTYLKRTNQYKFINPEKNVIQANLSNLSNSTQLNSFIKRENWEPLHWSSWLVISQYIFAVFVINLLRQFAVSYGRELVSYLIDLFSSLGIFDSSFKEDLISEDSRYRIINKPTTRFKNIAGIEQIFSQLSEIVWFLRNSKRFMDTGQNLPKGILLVGPPGTGKTLLVQAIAGEAQIPIFLQPVGAFNTTESLGAQRLQKLFEKAKQLSPCIIFFDEIDSIGKRRSHIIQNPAGTDNLFNIVSNTSWQTTQSLANSIPFHTTYITNPISERETTKMNTSIQSDSQDQQDSDQLSLLMQLLIELDGLQSSKKIVIIGATNRVEVLDPALIRPGRFDKVLKLGLPKKYKRIQICQLYAKILGMETKIYWEYIGNKTFGLSGADLATIMNQSSIDAILNGTKHTMQTIELAIHKIIGDSTKSTVIEERSLTKLNQNLVLNPKIQSFIPRLAYYQAGITVVKLFLDQFDTPIACSLFPKHENIRYKKVSNDFLTGQLQISRRHELKAQLIALYSGKISEFLYFKRGLITPNEHAFHSDFAHSDLTKASNLIYQIVDHWYLYVHNFSSDKLFQFSTNQNSSELLDSKTQNFLARLSESKEILTPSIEFAQYYNFQLWAGKSWWQIQVTTEETYTNVAYANWYRIYLKNPDEVIDNDEWVMPDQYYHNNETYFLTKTNHLNDIQLNQRDLTYQTILSGILNETFEFFHNSTEFIDFITTFLIRNKYLRRFEIDHLYNQFFK